MARIKAVAATGQLGTGFLEETLTSAAEGADFIGCDGGSTDPGPYYLGSGATQSSIQALTRDVEVMLRVGLDANIPVIIGSAGTAGGVPHVRTMRDIIQGVANKNGWHFELATIQSEVESSAIIRAYRNDRLRPLRGAPPISEATIRQSTRIVAMMGVEPIQRALSSGAQVVLAGRSSDVSIYAALPLLKGIPPEAAYHAAKILECGSASVTHRIYPDSMVSTIDEDGFIVEPPNPAMKCTPQSVASHTLYENADPYHLVEPAGVLDTSESRYEHVGERGVRVTGSRFIPSTEYTVRLEGATLVGYRSVVVSAIRDPLIVRQIDRFLQDLTGVVHHKVEDSLRVSPRDYSLRWRVYGKELNSLNSEAGTGGSADSEVALIFDTVAPTQSMASAISAIAWHTGLHHPVPEYSGGVSHLAFPFSPPSVDAGPVYKFFINHTWVLDDPCAPFPMVIESVN